MTAQAAKIIEQIKESDEHAIGALLAIYRGQTADEQAQGTTKYENEIGFNGADSGILSDMAKQYLNRGYLSPKQIAFVRRSITKYHKQLEAVGVEPAPIKQASLKKKANFQAITQGNQIKVTFPYNPERVAWIKNITGRRFDWDSKAWFLPRSASNIEELSEAGCKIDQTLIDWAEAKKPKPVKIDTIPGLNGTLYPFQTEAVEFIEAHHGRCVIGDDMGLGKTIVTAAWLKLREADALPAIVVCPAATKHQWKKVIEEWSNLTVEIAQGRKPKSAWTSDVLVINWDILSGWVDSIKSRSLTLILDESHYAKNQKAARTKAAFKLEQQVKHVIALTGTIMDNRIVDTWSQLHLVDKDEIPGFWKFTHRYCGATKISVPVYNKRLRRRVMKDVWDFTGASNLDEFHKLLSRFMVRRTKEQVFPDMPKKTRTVLPLDVKISSDYRRAVRELKDAIEEAKERGDLNVTNKFEALKQIALRCKLPQVIAWAENALEQEEKLVLFTWHKEAANILTEALKDYNPVTYTGETSDRNREIAKDEFINGDARVFIANIQAAGTGLDGLQKVCSVSAFVELAWSPMKHDQAEDRLNRIGQTKPVSCYYLIAKGTVEERIAELIDEKRAQFNAAVDGRGTLKNESILDMLFETM